MSKSAHDQAMHAMKQASEAARRGDLAAAERWTKIAERQALTQARLIETAPAQEDWAQDEADAAELRRRLLRFVKADQEIQAWEALAASHTERCIEAAARGAPAPVLPPHPAGPQGPAAEEDYMTAILLGPEP